MDSDTMELRRGMGALRRRWYLVLAAVLLCAAAAVGLSLLQDSRYEASATLLLTSDAPITTSGVVGLAPEEIATQAEVITSVQVAKRVVKALDLDVEPRSLLESVTVDEVDENQVIVVTATRPTPDEAAEVADSFVNGYLDYRAQQVTDLSVDNRAAYLQQLSTIERRLSEISDEMALAAGSERTRLTVERQALLVRQAAISAELVSLDTGTLVPLAAGEVLSKAEVPTTRSSPRPVRAGLLGGVIGLILGTGVALVRDHSDDVIRSADELERLGGEDNVPVLGIVPTSSRRESRRVVSLVAPKSPVAEAHRALDTNLRFLMAARRGVHAKVDRHGTAGEREPLAPIVMVTSAVEAEGKTSVATNIAVTAARNGQSVILVDADLRRPQIPERFGFDMPHGLSDVLVEGGNALSYLVEVGVAGLAVLPAGRIPPNPTELLASPTMQLVLRELAGATDLVVIDTAPVLPVSDTLELLPRTQLALLTVRARGSRLRTTSAAVRRMRQVGGNLDGVVVVDVPDKAVNFGYGYGTHSL